MTPEDEEFNRVEMESRVKQKYIRAMRKTTREEKISRPAVYEVPANNRMIASHQDHVRRLMEELAIAKKAREIVTQLYERNMVAWNDLDREVVFAIQALIAEVQRMEALAQPEQEPVKMVAYNCTCGKTMKFESLHGVVAPQRTWVGLTEEEVEGYWDWEDFQCGCGRGTLFEMVRNIEAKLKDKNT